MKQSWVNKPRYAMQKWNIFSRVYLSSYWSGSSSFGNSNTVYFHQTWLKHRGGNRNRFVLLCFVLVFVVSFVVVVCLTEHLNCFFALTTAQKNHCVFCTEAALFLKLEYYPTQKQVPKQYWLSEWHRNF